MNLPLRTLIVFLATAVIAGAHPVAQGAMEVRVGEGIIAVCVRVANEQIFVAEALGSGAGQASSLDDLWPRHGVYLLQHFTMRADGAPLSGRVAKVTPPENPTADGRTTYDLTYDLVAATRKPARLTLTQNLLNEIDFAPGNRWEATFLVRLRDADRVIEDTLLFTSQNPLELSLTPPPAGANPGERRLFREYLHHGVMHILTGYDHLLFVAALVLAVLTLADLVKVVSAFTLAHTLTLTLSALDLVRLPSRIVEPVIAASIVAVALQNVFWPERSRGWLRLVIAFGFGLFHGLGFAGGLLETMADLPGLAFTTAIVAFSIGVELGHTSVVLPLFGVLKLGRRAQASTAARDRFPRLAERFGSSAIGLAGLVYFVAALRQPGN